MSEVLDILSGMKLACS